MGCHVVHFCVRQVRPIGLTSSPSDLKNFGFSWARCARWRTGRTVRTSPRRWRQRASRTRCRDARQFVAHVRMRRGGMRGGGACGCCGFPATGSRPTGLTCHYKFGGKFSDVIVDLAPLAKCAARRRPGDQFATPIAAFFSTREYHARLHDEAHTRAFGILRSGVEHAHAFLAPRSP